MVTNIYRSSPPEFRFPQPDDRVDPSVRRCLAGLLNRVAASERLSLDELFQTLDRLEGLPDDRWDQKQIDTIFDEIGQYPCSLDLLEPLMKRRGKWICSAERKLLTQLRREFPRLNQALLSYELLSRKTKQMDLSRFSKCQVASRGQSFPAYQTGGADFEFMVHSAGVNEGEIDEVRKRRTRSGFLCASLVSGDAGQIYEPEQNYGMVIDFAPGTVVATTREDAFTPYNSSDPLTGKFYRFRQRLMLLTGYIDHLYAESGVQGKHPTDDFSRLNRLHSMMIEDPESREAALILEREIIGNQRIGAIHLKYQEGGILTRKLDLLARFYQDHPRKLAEIQRCQNLLTDILSDRTVYNYQTHPIQGVTEILAQTRFQSPHGQNKGGTRPYNEVNLDLVTFAVPGQNPFEVRALLMDRIEFLKKPDFYYNLFSDAEKNQIPILFLEQSKTSHRALTQSIVETIKRSLSFCAVEDWFRKYGAEISDQDMEEVLVSVAGCDLYCDVDKLFQLIRRAWPDLRDEVYIKAFDAAREGGKAGNVVALFQTRPELLGREIEKTAERVFTGDPFLLVAYDCLSQTGKSIDYNFAKRVVQTALKTSNFRVIERVMNNSEIDSASVEKWCQGDESFSFFFDLYEHIRKEGRLPSDSTVQKVFRHAVRETNLKVLTSMLETPAFGLSPQMVEEIAAQNSDDRSILILYEYFKNRNYPVSSSMVQNALSFALKVSDRDVLQSLLLGNPHQIDDAMIGDAIIKSAADYQSCLGIEKVLSLRRNIPIEYFRRAIRVAAEGNNLGGVQVLYARDYQLLLNDFLEAVDRFKPSIFTDSAIISMLNYEPDFSQVDPERLFSMAVRHRHADLLKILISEGKITQEQEREALRILSEMKSSKIPN